MAAPSFAVATHVRVALQVDTRPARRASVAKPVAGQDGVCTACRVEHEALRAVSALRELLNAYEELERVTREVLAAAGSGELDALAQRVATLALHEHRRVRGRRLLAGGTWSIALLATPPGGEVGLEHVSIALPDLASAVSGDDGVTAIDVGATGARPELQRTARVLLAEACDSRAELERLCVRAEASLRAHLAAPAAPDADVPMWEVVRTVVAAPARALSAHSRCATLAAQPLER